MQCTVATSPRGRPQRERHDGEVLAEMNVHQVDPAGPGDLRHRGYPVQLAEPPDRQARPDDPGPNADELHALGAWAVRGDHGLPDAARVERLGQPGGVDLHATDGVEARGSRERLGRGLVDGTEAQDSHVDLPGHASQG
jgi:hypothetical protein